MSIVLLVMIGIPLIIHFLAWVWSLKGLGVGAVEGWIGFWGSYLGGVLSTFGVIATTFIILRRNDKAIELQDEKIRRKEYVFYELQQIEEANKILVQCSNLLLRLNEEYRIIATKIIETNEYTIGKTMGKFDTDNYNQMVDEYRENIRTFSNLRSEYYELFELFKYKMNIFAKSNAITKKLNASVEQYFIKIKNSIEVLSETKLAKNEGDILLEKCLLSIEEEKKSYFEIEREVKSELKSILLQKLNEFKNAMN
ncbi:hypothetical protein [Metalysinibacillus jejuensis]|uniref:hypothetical protein n=1 Tax=Metalysinibacillus jejuensis TaxID=914327 RepID=UPI00128FDCC9|nr:hypothetical protein [Metalysinibacillus jejuensis]